MRFQSHLHLQHLQSGQMYRLHYSCHSELSLPARSEPVLISRCFQFGRSSYVDRR